MIKAIIFDIGGVLAYDVWEHLLCDRPSENPADPVSVATKFNLPRDQVRAVGQLLWKDYERRSASNASTRKQYEKEYWSRFKEYFPTLQNIRVTKFIGMTDPFIRPIKGMAEGNPSLLEKLEKFNALQSKSDKKIVLAICSNNNAFWFLRQKTKLNLERFFTEDHIFVSHEKGMTKPELLGLAVKKLESEGIESDECVFIDDRPQNIIDAVRQYHMIGILFPTSHRDEGADYVTALLEQKGLSI